MFGLARPGADSKALASSESSASSFTCTHGGIELTVVGSDSAARGWLREVEFDTTAESSDPRWCISGITEEPSHKTCIESEVRGMLCCDAVLPTITSDPALAAGEQGCHVDLWLACVGVLQCDAGPETAPLSVNDVVCM